MVTYDTTLIAIFVSLVLMVAVIGTTLALGMLGSALSSSRRTRTPRPASRPVTYGKLALHH
jgi:hypothetical protein